MSDSVSLGAVGLTHGDILTELNGTEIDTIRRLPGAIAQSPVGRPAFLTVLRDGQKHTLSVTLEERPDKLAQEEEWQVGDEQWGVTVANLTAEAVFRFHLYHGEVGVVVVAVVPDSPAEYAGLRPGNVKVGLCRREDPK